MNLLVINSRNRPLRNSLVEYLEKNNKIQSIFLLEREDGFNENEVSKINNEERLKFKNISINNIEKELLATKINKIVQDLNESFNIIYVEECNLEYNGDFVKFKINDFKELLLREINFKVSFFQILLHEIKSLSLNPQILFIVPETAQTKLIGKNIPQSILFSTFHMLTTAIADEFIDYNIYCNGVLENENYLETLEWLLFENKELPHGKLIKNKKIIDW